MYFKNSSLKMPPLLSVIFVFICLLIAQLEAGTTGKLAGRIKSTNGESLAGANIVISSKIIGEKEMKLVTPFGAAADIYGDFFILNVPPGKYVVECSMIGFEKVIQKPVYVTVDRTTTLEFSLSEQILDTDEIVVIAERPLIVKDLTSTSAKVSGEVIETLPVESFREVLSLQAGITTGIGGGLHIRGGRSSEIKYYVDGIAVSNPFNNALSVPVETNSIQELEVISGTFNAEYGQAQSGIVNIVTKEGSRNYTGSVSVYTGDFISTNDGVFWNIDDINPFSQKYLEASLSGPIFSKLSFFASTKITDHENWLYGRRVFLPSDSSNFLSRDAAEWFIGSSGDSAFVSMNPSQGYSGQLKLAYQLKPAFKLSYNILANYSENRFFNGAARLNPESQRTHFTTSFNHLIDINHTISASAFYNFKLAYYENDYKSYLHKNVFNPAYYYLYRPDSQEPANVFSTGGLDGIQLFRNSKTYAVKGDLNVQANKANLLKIGFEYRQHNMNLEDYAIEVNHDLNRWLIPPLSSSSHDAYNRKPLEVAAYIQDKIEIDDLIVNVGIRFDYFNSDGRVPTDLRDPNDNIFPDENPSNAYTGVDSKTQISPRLGLAFPISEKGVIHAAYGQFFQIPEFERLYQNPEFEVSGSSAPVIGNAGLDAQRTDMYEIGLQQQIASLLALDVTAYYRNIRELLGSELQKTYQTDIVYGRYVNNSYGNVLGLILATKIRVPRYGVTADLNYTYQSAKGVASDPTQAFVDQVTGSESLAFLNPLDWDLVHSFNGFLNYNLNKWAGSVIVRMNSGYPFTPANFPELRNQGRFKGDLAVDLNVVRRFSSFAMDFEVFAKVINIFDQKRNDLLPQINPQDVQIHNEGGKNVINSLYEYVLNPAIQPVPREIRLGIKMIF